MPIDSHVVIRWLHVSPFINFYSYPTFYSLDVIISLALNFRTFSLILTANICLMLIGSQLLIGLSYAQSSNIEKGSKATMLVKSKPQGVKITFPAQGQRVTGDKNLTLIGTSTYDNRDCQVSIIVNNIKPYQRVIGTGQKGTNDYSTWKFPLGDKYATLKAGSSNKATAKLTCIDKPMNLTKYYSVNFTSSSTSSTSHVQQSALKNSSNSTSSNTNKTQLSSPTQHESTISNPSYALTKESSKPLRIEQKSHHDATLSGTGAENHRLNHESMPGPNNSMDSEVKTPFVLSTPTTDNNSSVSSGPTQLQSDSHSKNNDENSHHNKN